jgi:hypothetical protein
MKWIVAVVYNRLAPLVKNLEGKQNALGVTYSFDVGAFGERK